MPAPDVVGRSWEAEQPHTPSEIIGRGPQARKSKSFIKDGELATLLGMIRGYPGMLEQVFRELHARHYTRVVEREDGDGNVVEVEVPEVLGAEEIRERYPMIRVWEQMHQEQVEHYPSIEGFSIKAATGAREEERRSREEESSAGADRVHRGNGRGEEPPARWR